ncbi:hypothetical protein MP228_000379 [Amoeboaphelidium protococcarum]|nr:hypothetical protein MP228_000379 [Amoeboaphelidium protococcarum]
MKQRVLSLNCIRFWLSLLYLPADVASSSSCSPTTQSVVSLLFPVPRLPAFGCGLIVLLDPSPTIVPSLRLLGVMVLSAQGVSSVCLSQCTLRIKCTSSPLLTMVMSSICNICGLAHQCFQLSVGAYRFTHLISIIPLSKVATLRRFKTQVSTSTIIYGAQKSGQMDLNGTMAHNKWERLGPS